MNLKALSLGYLVLVALAAPTLHADDRAQPAARAATAARNDFFYFSAQVCQGFFGRQQDETFCRERLNSFSRSNPIPDAFDLPAYKLAFARAACSATNDGGDAYSAKCWQSVVKEVSHSRTDSDAFKDSVLGAAAGCVEKKGRKFLGIGSSTTYKSDCLDQAIADLKGRLPGRPSSPSTDVGQVGAPALAQSTPTQTRTPPCTVGADAGTALKVGGKSPIGDGNEIIVTHTGVIIKTPSDKKVRTFAYSKGYGWSVYSAGSDRTEVDWNDVDVGRPKKLLDEKIQIEYGDGWLKIRSNDGGRPTLTTVTTSAPNKKHEDEPYLTRIDVQSGTTNLGTFTSTITKARHDADWKAEDERIDALRETDRKAQRKTWQNAFYSRMLAAPAAQVNLTGPTPWQRQECKAPENLAAVVTAGVVQNTGDAAAPR